MVGEGTGMEIAVLVLVTIFTTLGAGFWFRCVLSQGRELPYA
jgi:hypothetical protein